MARASGPAIDQLTPADFTHAASGVHYRVYAENNAAMLAFDRPDDPSMRGARRLEYFIGSGHRGRTYLFSLDGFFFESPVNWYAQKKIVGRRARLPAIARDADESRCISQLPQLPHQRVARAHRRHRK